MSCAIFSVLTIIILSGAGLIVVAWINLIACYQVTLYFNSYEQRKDQCVGLYSKSFGYCFVRVPRIDCRFDRTIDLYVQKQATGCLLCEVDRDKYTAILIVGCITFAVSLKILLIWICFRRPNRISDSGAAAPTADVEQPPPPQHITDTLIINVKPASTKLEGIKDTCVICLEEVNDSNMVTINKNEVGCNCTTVYCKECLKEWLEKNGKCPICRL